MLTLHKQCVHMNTQVLLEKVRENYSLYLKDYEEAKKDYQDIVRSNTAKLNAALSENIFDNELIYFRVAAPIDYSDKYLTIIEMLEYSNSETIELDTTAFKAYVKNQWDWTDTFSNYAKSLKSR